MRFLASNKGREVDEAVKGHGTAMTLIECPCCDACYEVPRDAIPPAGCDVKCSNCEYVWFFEHQAHEYPSIACNAETKSVAINRADADEIREQVNTAAPVSARKAIPMLTASELRVLISGSEHELQKFVESQRTHAVDAKGDTPLHIVARLGSLLACDLFIAAGADPEALNHDRQTPADVAFAEGHGLVAQLLSALVTNVPEAGTVSECEIDPALATCVVGPDATQEHQSVFAHETGPACTTDDLDDLLHFEPEAGPEEFFDRCVVETASGTFVALVNSSAVVSDEADADWALDISPAPIAGDGIGSGTVTVADQVAEGDFLTIRNRGRKSFAHFAEVGQ